MSDTPGLDPARWRRAQELFHEALERPPQERDAFLAAATEGDHALADVVRDMLREDASEGSLLDHDVAHAARSAFASGAAPPAEIGPYRLIRPLGEGGMGVVHLAERTDLHSHVAIKFLRDAWASSARRERFLSEQRLLAQLRHPSIAQILDAGVLPEGTPWFAMEFVEGLPLDEYCRRHALGVRARLKLFRAVCEAVLHAHQRAVIHRDLKPANILVTAGAQVKLLDFGIARPLEADTGGDASTRTGQRFLTPAYAAPEQVRGGTTGVHTDVYSLGVVLYELLAERRPYVLEGCTAAEAERLVCDVLPPRPSAVASAPDRRESWSDLDVLCLTAMQKESSRRYRSVDSLLRDLDHYLAGEPLEARSDGAGYRLGKFARRNWRALAATAGALAVLVALVTGYTMRLADARNAALAQSARAERIQRFMVELFEGDDASAGPSDTLRVVSLLERGAQEARLLDAVPDVQADLLATLGGIQQKLGRFEQADTLLRAALAIRRRTAAGDSIAFARGLVAMGWLRAEQSELDEADSLARTAIAMFERNPRTPPAELAGALRTLGGVLELKGDYASAIDVLTRTARLDSLGGGSSAEASETLTQLANNHFYTGHLEVADSLNRRVLALDRVLHGERHPHVASDLLNLGAVQFEWGRWAEAERFDREALAIYREWYGEQHYETAASLTMLGRALIAQDELAEADSVLRRALRTREHVFGSDHPSVASTLNELARVAQKQKRFDDAEAGFSRMLAIYRGAYGEKHYLIGLALTNLGAVDMDRGRPRDAEPRFRDALRRYAETLPADHAFVGIGRLRLGRSLLRQRRHAEALAESRAGYDLLLARAKAPQEWLRSGREDLIAEYEALGRKEEARALRTGPVSTR
ncbi:MAG: serine/threonine protein kinase [Candidatus Eisenbacteria bacterium]|nr:serine/threonine protein kinase [Candidatus Eisenbacteria bacterium]